jgi:hypothetical protein
MRIVVGWDGSDHALTALRGLGALFLPAAFEHIEIVLPVWPARDIPRWAAIEEQQVFSDDLHQAAALTAADELSRLTAVLKPLAKSISGNAEAGNVVDLFLAAVKRSRADMVFIAAGSRDPSDDIEHTLIQIVQTSPVPTLVLRSPNTTTKP